MARGDKSKYTDKQKRKAAHIAESYESRGVPEKEAEQRAWATVNKEDGGGKHPGGSGRGHMSDRPASREKERSNGSRPDASPQNAPSEKTTRTRATPSDG